MMTKHCSTKVCFNIRPQQTEKPQGLLAPHQMLNQTNQNMRKKQKILQSMMVMPFHQVGWFSKIVPSTQFCL